MHGFKPARGRRLDGRFRQLVAKDGKVGFCSGEARAVLRDIDFGTQVPGKVDLRQGHAGILVIRLQLRQLDGRAEILRGKFLRDLEALPCHLEIGLGGGTLFIIGAARLGRGAVQRRGGRRDFRPGGFDPRRKRTCVDDDKDVTGLDLTTFDSRNLARRAADLGGQGDDRLWLGHAAGPHRPAYLAVFHHHRRNDRRARGSGRAVCRGGRRCVRSRTVRLLCRRGVRCVGVAAKHARSHPAGRAKSHKSGPDVRGSEFHKSNAGSLSRLRVI